MLNLSQYDPTDSEGLLLRLEEVWYDLCNARQALAESKISRHDAYMDGATHSQEHTVAGQKRDGEWQSSPYTIEVLREEGKVAALEEERDFILWLLTQTPSNS